MHHDAHGDVSSLPSLGMLGQSQSLKKKKRSSAGESDPGRASADRPKVNVSAGEKKVRLVKGVECWPCGRGDGDADDVFPDQLLLWAYPPKHDGSVDGYQCLCCNKAFNAKFKARVKTMKQLRSQWSDYEEEFMAKRKVVCEVSKKKGDPKVQDERCCDNRRVR